MMTISLICRNAPLDGRNTKVCMWGEVSDIITPVINVDRFRVFIIFEGLKIGVFPLRRRVALTTVLHYRADCDFQYSCRAAIIAINYSTLF